MRLKFDDKGYVCCILYGCFTDTCAEYTGTVPTQPEAYEDIDDWANRAKIQAYKLDSNGNLVYDAAKAASLPNEDDVVLVPYTEEELDKLGIISAIQNQIKATIFDAIYPIGSLYISAKDSDPSTLFGGSWQKIEDRFLLAAGSVTAGSMGGNATHKHLAPVGTRANNTAATIIGKYGYEDKQSVSGNKSAFTTTNNATAYSDLSVPYTSEASTLPPYLAVYVWQRTA